MSRPAGSNADEWLAFLSEHDQSYAAVQIAEAIDALEKLVFVPGLWRCPRCDFQLLQSNLNACDGSVTARNQPGDKCPNCHGPLWRVTERQAGNDMVDRCEEQVLRAIAAEKALAEQARAHAARVAELLDANNREVDRRRRAEAERDQWNRDARRLSAGLCVIHEAPATATATALKSVAYDIALNCISPEVAKFQIEKRGTGA